MESEPVRLSLDVGPAEAIATAVDVLTRWIDKEHLRLGGGTTLEARWHHRTSTDLDFFALPEHADTTFYQRTDMMVDDLRQLAAEGIIAKDGLRLTGRAVIHFRVGDTPVSFGRVDGFHGDPGSEVEESTGVILSGTRDILTKRMFNRLAHNQLATERDAYDFAVARSLAPSDLSYAWNRLSTDMKGNAIEMYRDMATGRDGALHRLKGVPRRYRHLATNLWDHALQMLESDLEYAPPLAEDHSAISRGKGGHER